MASTVARHLGRIAKTPSTTGETKGTVFFLHGTCDSGHGLKNWTSRLLGQEFNFKTYRVVYPSAPSTPYNLMDNQNASVWFNRLSPGPHMPEDRLSINEIAERLNEMIHMEQETSKVIVGGFSTGGIMALHLGYRFNLNISGIFALSSFLNTDSSVFKHLENYKRQNPQEDPDDCSKNVTDDGKILEKPDPKKNMLPQLLMSHGAKDPLVHAVWSQRTFDKLRSYGAEGHLYTFPNQAHEITKTQLLILHNWIEEVLSDAPKPRITTTKPHHVNDEHAVPLIFLNS